MVISPAIIAHSRCESTAQLQPTLSPDASADDQTPPLIVVGARSPIICRGWPAICPGRGSLTVARGCRSPRRVSPAADLEAVRPDQGGRPDRRSAVPGPDGVNRRGQGAPRPLNPLDRVTGPRSRPPGPGMWVGGIRLPGMDQNRDRGSVATPRSARPKLLSDTPSRRTPRPTSTASRRVSATAPMAGAVSMGVRVE